MSESYAPIGPVEDWTGLSVDPARWERILGQILDLRGDANEFSWLDGPLRATAYQSGAIEGLHGGDRGLTLTLIDAVADWEAEVLAQEDNAEVDVGAFIAAGTEALQSALTVATGHEEISEIWIREIHRVVCGPQRSYEVRLPDGSRTRRPLPKGAYKEQDNHVLTPDGAMHHYAPELDTPDEMRRLIEVLRSKVFEDLHPVTQAAYAHHGLTHIHPFVDGNGRVARVLASVYLLRATSLPLFLFADERDRYFDALLAADRGAPEIFVNLVAGAVDDLASVITQRRQAATRRQPDIDSAVERWELAVHAAERLGDLVEETRDAVLEGRSLRGERVVKGWGGALDNLMKIATFTGRQDRTVPGDVPTFRDRYVSIQLRLTDDESIGENIRVRLKPTELDKLPLTLDAQESGLTFACRIDDVEPAPKHALRIRLEAWMEEVVDDVGRRFEALIGP